MLSDKGKESVPQGMEFKGRDGQTYFLLQQSIYRGMKCIAKNGKPTGTQ